MYVVTAIRQDLHFGEFCFLQSVLSSAVVDLPFAAREIDASLDVLQASLQRFHMAPQQALDEIAHSHLR